MYEVGQILYLLSNKNNKVVPSRVESVISVRKSSGVVVTHEVSVAGHDSLIELEKLNVRVFNTAADLRSHMVDFLVKQVDEELRDVSQAIKAAWPDQSNSELPTLSHQDPAREPAELEQELTAFDSDPQIVELENGMKARVHIPKEMM